MSASGMNIESVDSNATEDAKLATSSNNNKTKTDTCTNTESSGQKRKRADGDGDAPLKPSAGDDRNKRTEGEGVEDTKEYFLCLRKLTPYFGSSAVMKLLAEHGVKPIAVEKKPKKVTAFAVFASAQARDAAEKKLSEAKDEKGKPAFVIGSVPHNYAKRRKTAVKQRASMKAKWDKRDAEERKTKLAHEVVAPLASLPYEEQLVTKKRDMKGRFSKFTNRMKKMYNKSLNLDDNGQVVTLDDIVPSPVQDGYRNKCEFTIGEGVDGKAAVGFIGGAARHESIKIMVADPALCKNTPPVHIALAAIIQAFVRDSKYACFDRHNKTGLYRMVTFRDGCDGQQLMVCLQVSEGEQLDDPALSELKVSFTKYMLANVNFNDAFKQEHKSSITTLLWNTVDKLDVVSSENSSVEVLFGPGYIHETLLGKQFRVSLSAFFQVNTKGAEKLFTIASEWARCGPETILLDVCCGTGTIGICMSSQVKHVYGLEIVEKAVEDAKVNALRNHVNNATFIAGKAEDTLPALLKEHRDWDNVVAIVDPPRSGLHPSVLKALRRCSNLKRLVYVSCNPNSMINDLPKLIRPSGKKFPSKPFKPLRAVPVDMFPHTKHCEMVMLLERQ